MSRSRDLVGGVGGAATTLTSAGYHATSGDPAALHGHVLQQKILEVTWKNVLPHLHSRTIRTRSLPPLVVSPPGIRSCCHNSLRISRSLVFALREQTWKLPFESRIAARPAKFAKFRASFRARFTRKVSMRRLCFQLQQQHQLQQQILRQQYQAQERQLAELHEQQMHQLKVSCL